MLLPRRQQKVTFAIHCRLAQPLQSPLTSTWSRAHVQNKRSTNRHKPEQEKDDIGDQVSLVPLPIAGSGPVATTMRSARAR